MKSCEVCGAAFPRRARDSEAQRLARRFCSYSCSRAATIACPDCDGLFRVNTLVGHRRSHDPALQDQKRTRKNRHQSAYNQTPEGRATKFRYRHSPKGRRSNRLRNDVWRQTESGRVARAAHGKVAGEIHAGRLTRQPCATCAATPAFAHHPRGYEGAAALDVIWLCQKHHMEAHGRVYAAA